MNQRSFISKNHVTEIIEEVIISGSIAPVFAIQWAQANKVKDLTFLSSVGM